MADPQEESELAKALRIIRDLPHPPKPMADPQHPDIAALIERLDARAMDPKLLRLRDIELLEQAAAALSTLARPAEDEEVRDLADLLTTMGLTGGASLLARLARERASAEQEAARLREIVVEMDGELRLARAALGDRELADTLAHINYAIGDAERALAAAAGAEEPHV